MPNTSRPRVDGSLGKALSQRCSAQGRRPALQKAESARSGGGSGHLGPFLREGQATSPHRLLRQDLCSYLHRRFLPEASRPACDWLAGEGAGQCAPRGGGVGHSGSPRSRCVEFGAQPRLRKVQPGGL